MQDNLIDCGGGNGCCFFFVVPVVVYLYIIHISIKVWSSASVR
jgi:hypothetical protein